MKFKTNSIYAINKKNPNKIIFESLAEHEEHFIELKDGVVTEHYINHKDVEATFSTISRSITAETFIILKAEHDEDLRLWDNTESNDGKMICSIHLLEDTRLVSVPSPQEILSKQADEIEFKEKQDKRKEKGLAIFATLTEVQKRRYIMSVVDGLSTHDIAEIEGVNQYAVWKTIEQVKNKIEKNKKRF